MKRDGQDELAMDVRDAIPVSLELTANRRLGEHAIRFDLRAGRRRNSSRHRLDRRDASGGWEVHDHALARALRVALTADRMEGEVELLIALAADAQRDPRDALCAAGYDGFCRTPCPVWWMIDVLKCFYAD